MYTSKVVVSIIFLATLLLNWPLALWSRRSDHTANHGKALFGNAGNQDGEVSWLKELSVPNSNRNIKNKDKGGSLLSSLINMDTLAMNYIFRFLEFYICRLSICFWIRLLFLVTLYLWPISGWHFLPFAFHPFAFYPFTFFSFGLLCWT